jgi:hypothetical protein
VPITTILLGICGLGTYNFGLFVALGFSRNLTFGIEEKMLKHRA